MKQKRNKHNKFNRVGEKFKTREGYEVEIIEYFNSENCTIIINDYYKTIFKNRCYSDIIKNNIKNPYHPTIFDIGFIGVGNYSSKDKIVYSRWVGMLRRCYCEEHQKQNPTYKDVTVCTEWHNFQNFAEWFENNYIKDWHLDKDILVKGNKVYSSKTCCFVPQEINNLFLTRSKNRGKNSIGVHFIVSKNKFIASININGKNKRLGYFDTENEAFKCYKSHKEYYIQVMAEKFKSELKQKVYKKLINYKVNATD